MPFGVVSSMRKKQEQGFYGVNIHDSRELSNAASVQINTNKSSYTRRVWAVEFHLISSS